MKYLILSEKSWNKHLPFTLREKLNAEWILIDKKENFTVEILEEICPAKIFIPHWSYLIPERIFKNYECIVFHMTDLPFGRGGSPLQNLIDRGIDKTKVSAIKVEKGIDTGDVYLKKELSLLGPAEEIFIRANKIIEKMIVEIIEKDLKPYKQDGEAVEFKRRKPEQGDISVLDSLEKVYDYIRMLDATGYPKAFLETDSFRFEFSRASLKADESIIADVKIFKKVKN
jgi:methionyl-tRNA formyltransferase